MQQDPAMTFSTNTRQLLNLGHRGVQSIEEDGDTQITCTRGSIWLTLDNDSRDIVLEAGESFTVAGGERVVVYAFEVSTVEVRSAAPEAGPAGHLRGRLPRTTAQVRV